MRRRQSRSPMPVQWPPALRNLVHAVEVECPKGHAQAFRELTLLALTKTPSRGIFDPSVRGEHELFTAIESVAKTHLDLAAARTVWRRAVEAADLDLERRDEIESATLQVQSISDTAYFYAGLAFGLAFVYVCPRG